MMTRTQPARVSSNAALVGIVLLLGTAVRIWIAARSGMWRDESQGLFVASLPSVGDMLNFLHWHESHPPLYYFLMRFWMAVFGRSDTALIGLQVAVSVLTTFAVYKVTDRIFGRMAALFACVLTVCTALVVESSVTVRPYAFLQLGCLISVWLLWKLLTEETTALVQGSYVVVTLTLLYTHNWAWLVLMGEVTAIGAVLLYRRFHLQEPSSALMRRVLHLLSALILILALYAPWLPVLLRQAADAGHPPEPFTLISGSRLMAATWGFPSAALLAALAAVSQRGRKTGARLHSAELPSETAVSPMKRHIGYIVFLAVPTVSIVIALLLSAHSSLAQQRCFSIVWPCLLIVTGQIIARGCSLYAQSRLTAVISVFLLTVMVLQSVLRLCKIHQREKSNARELAAFLAKAVGPSDLIVIAPEWLAGSFNWYYKGQGREAVFPSGGYEALMPYDHVIDRTIDPGGFAVLQAELGYAKASGQRVWFLMDALSVPGRDTCTADSQPQLDRKDYSAAGNAQSRRLYCLLTSLFGEPSEQLASQGMCPGAEMRAFLFTLPERRASAARSVMGSQQSRQDLVTAPTRHKVEMLRPRPVPAF